MTEPTAEHGGQPTPAVDAGQSSRPEPPGGEDSASAGGTPGAERLGPPRGEGGLPPGAAPPWATRTLPAAVDVQAPDGSEIRLLVDRPAGSMVHCSLPPGRVTRAVRHRTVEEVWYFLSGVGEVWRRAGRQEQVVQVRPGLALTIPLGTDFQFRTVGAEPLVFLIVTMPPWPGPEEAVFVAGRWAVGSADPAGAQP
jgi:mannose-6-phosphate isomerase-like protein (cupin superfamily)